jgi:hypothetical protein
VEQPGNQADTETASTPPRRPWRRWRYQVAAAGIAVALGGGAFVVVHGGPGRTGIAPDNRAKTATGDAVSGASGPAVSTTGSRAGTPSPVGRVPKSTAPAVVDVDVTVSSSGSLPKDHRTLRVVTARSDLTGQRELAWAADAGYAVGKAKCTQNFRFSETSRVGERPTMLLCWRTSAQKSVVVIAVDIDKRPSAQKSVATLNRIWSRLR